MIDERFIPSLNDRDEALASLRTSRAFFGRWDPEVLELYVRCGMVSSADQKSIELKMPGLQVTN